MCLAKQKQKCHTKVSKRLSIKRGRHLWHKHLKSIDLHDCNLRRHRNGGGGGGGGALTFISLVVCLRWRSGSEAKCRSAVNACRRVQSPLVTPSVTIDNQLWKKYWGGGGEGGGGGCLFITSIPH